MERNWFCVLLTLRVYCPTQISKQITAPISWCRRSMETISPKIAPKFSENKNVGLIAISCSDDESKLTTICSQFCFYLPRKCLQIVWMHSTLDVLLHFILEQKHYSKLFSNFRANRKSLFQFSVTESSSFKYKKKLHHVYQALS